ncbi:MAG: G8 domain-containing protein [Cyanobacteria bacterium P01_F01_bin.86]
MDTHNHNMTSPGMNDHSMMHSHDQGSSPHADDPAKHSEHMALLDLLPPEKATHRAIANGNWSDASTWEGGKIPDADADVFIPEGVAVTYDVGPGSNPELHYVRVNGELNFATDQDTAMKVDTLMTDVNSTLTIGTEKNPMPAQFSASIEIADNGPITNIRDIDPLQLSRGVVTHGKVSIQGAEKESHLVMKAASAGDTTIEVEGDASGWQVGDTIVVIGTKYLGEDKNGQLMTQDEEVTITKIEGNTFTLSDALEYDHAPPEGHSDLDVYVGNGSRNIRIFSENSGIENQRDVLSRGHFMVMHNPDAVIRNAEFTDLGRTNKSIAADDATKNNHGKVVSLDPTQADNVRGRYALHLHRTGATDGSQLAIVEGNAVNGSPGWGIVQHDSHAIVNDNFVYDIVGAGIVAETGNETGEWNDNLVTKVIGGNENTGAGEGVNDFGNEGHAFENVSRLIIQQDNIAANSLRGWHFREASLEINPDPDAMPLNFEPMARQTEATSPAILDFERNTAIGVSRGFDSNHRMNHLDNEVINDIEDFTAWEVANNGVNMYATNLYTFENLKVIGVENGRFNQSGIQFSQGVDSIIVNGGHFENLKTVFSGAGDYAYDATKTYSESALIDVTAKNTDKWFENGGTPEILSSSDINSSGIASFEPDEYADFSMSPDQMYVHIAGTITDGLGERKYGVFDMVHVITNAEGQEFGVEMELNRNTFEPYLQRYGVFEDADGLYTTLTLFMGDRVTGDVTPRTLKITLEGFERSYIDGVVDVKTPLASHKNLITADSANTLYRQNMIDYGNTTGTDGDDYIKSEKTSNTIKAGEGDDKIFTGGYKDHLDGGAGDDEIWSFHGDDTIDGGAGADRLYAGLGDDRIYASVEDVIVNAGTHQEHNGGDTVVFDGRRSDYQILSYADNNQFFVSDGQNQVLVQETENLEFSQDNSRFKLKDRENPFEFDGTVDQQYYRDYAAQVNGRDGSAPRPTPTPPTPVEEVDDRNPGHDHGDMPDMGHGETPDGHDHGDMPDMGQEEIPEGDGHDHGDMPDMGETPDGEMPEGDPDHGGMPDMGETPDMGGDAATPDVSNDSGIELLDGASFGGQTSDAVVIEHQTAFEAESGSLSFRFKAADTDGQQALMSKDSSGFDNGGHLTLWMEGNKLSLRAQTQKQSFKIHGGTVTTGAWHDVDVNWGAEGVKLSLNGAEIGQAPGFTHHLVNNLEPIVFGAQQWSSGNQIADKLGSSFSGEIADATFSASTITAQPQPVADYTGTVGQDRLRGSKASEIFQAGGGNDRVHAKGGDDTIYGGKGNDRLWGGSGNDHIIGGKGNDRLWGGSGNDHIIGGKGNDHLAGGTGRDVLEGGEGADTFAISGTWGTHYWRSSDFATISDFAVGKDKIQLHSEAADHHLGAIFKDDTSVGVGIFIGKNKDNLIAVLENVSTEQLSLEDSNFSYV